MFGSKGAPTICVPSGIATLNRIAPLSRGASSRRNLVQANRTAQALTTVAAASSTTRRRLRAARTAVVTSGGPPAVCVTGAMNR